MVTPESEPGPDRPPASAGFPRWFLPGAAIALFVAYCIFVLAPIAVLLQSGWAFAGDPSEYLLTAHRGFGSGPGELPYVFPALPVLYAPLNALNVPFGVAYAVADLVSGVLVIALAVAFGVLGYVVGRSRLAALATAASAGTFPAILGEVGWGGQAQFLAITLGVLGVALLLSASPEVASLQARLGAGTLFAVAALAEPYAAACLVIFGAVAMLLSAGFRGLRPRPLAGYLPVLAPPLLAALFVNEFAGSSAPQGLGPAVLLYAASRGGWGFAVAAAGFDDLWTVLAYALVLGAVVAVAVVPPGIDRRAGAAAGGAVAAFLAETFLVTPATYWPRAASFFVVPLAVATAVLVSRIPRRRAEPEVAAPSRWLLRRLERRGGGRRAARWVRRATAAVALALVAVQVTVAYGAYPGGLQFNEFDTGSVGQLAWLRSASGSVVLVAPEALTFPVAYATERPIYPAVQPFWFDTSEERAAAVFASTLVAGSTWISADPLELVEGGPPGSPSTPSVFVYESAYLIPLGTIVDEEGGVYGHTVENHPSAGVGLWPTAPASGATLSGETHLPTYNVTTVSSVSPNGSVDVNFTFRPAGGSPASVGVGFAFPQVGIKDLSLPGQGAALVATFQEAGGTAVDLPLKVTVAANSSATVSAPTVEVTTAQSTLLWNVTPSSGGEFNVSITLILPSLSASVAALVSESSALAANDVRWVVVDSATNASALPRFELDGLFSLDRSSDTFDVFRVL